MSTYTAKTFEAGDYIFEEGHVGDTAYLIKSGSVKISKRGSDGQPKTIAVYGAGEMIGEMALIDLTTRSASAVALEVTQTIEVNIEDLQARLERSDDVVLRMIKALTKRLRKQADLIAQLSTGDLVEDTWKTRY